MKTRSIRKNFIYNLGYQILTIILPIITTPYISRVLGAYNVGIYGYTLSISAYFILFGSLGTVLYGQREIAYVQNDKKEYSKRFWEINILRLITMLISLLIFFIVFVNKSNDYYTYYLILSLEIIGNIFNISWLFQGLEAFKEIVLRNLIIKAISIACIFIFVKGPEDLEIYFLIYVLSVIFGNLAMWLYLPKTLTKVKLNELHVFKHLKPMVQLFIPQIAIEVYTVLDRTMLGRMILDKTEVGYYTQSQKIIKVLLVVVASLGTVMLPRIASKFSKKDTAAIKKYIEKSFKMVFLMAIPLIFGILAVTKEFVPLFFGEGYDRCILLMNVLCPILLFIGMSNVIGMQYLLPTKQQTKFTISVTIGAIVNFIMNFILIPKLGALGASIGTITAELCVTLFQIFVTRKELEYKSLIKSLIKYILSGFIMFIIIFEINIGTHLLTNLIIKASAGAIIYFGVLYISKEEFFISLLNDGKRFIKNTLKRR